ncbi:MAG: DUF1573 domain-containing protein [Bacteroidetes bacterium]|nr:DUF1573 domain-containing protein [Bacteroidota bacterium]
MKKLSFAIALLFMTTLVSAQTEGKAGKQKKSKTVEQTAPPATVQIEFETQIIDFGNIQKTNSSEPVETVFRFKNADKMPIKLTSVRATCGCTVPEWTKDPILPGATGEIRVKYNNTHIEGTFSKSITVVAEVDFDKQIEANQKEAEELQKKLEANPKKAKAIQKKLEKNKETLEELNRKKATTTLSLTIKGNVVNTQPAHDHSDPNHTH